MNLNSPPSFTNTSNPEQVRSGIRRLIYPHRHSADPHLAIMHRYFQNLSDGLPNTSASLQGAYHPLFDGSTLLQTQDDALLPFLDATDLTCDLSSAPSPDDGFDWIKLPYEWTDTTCPSPSPSPASQSSLQIQSIPC